MADLGWWLLVSGLNAVGVGFSAVSRVGGFPG